MSAIAVPRLMEALDVAASAYVEFSSAQHASSRLLADRAFVSTFVGFLAPDVLDMDEQEQRDFKIVAKVLGLPDPLVPFGKRH
ncbi:hypothetical protein [Jeongeupia chitinilytica]|uniref:Uncharacterized protein n=1 Tax=Jeongeupia chitinilytica TaxID=1041641 RepID=A0ABQ3H4N0_9NEIS|nr:hypothetical protein [Jeongeupia chitinilytica]GHD66097.1 hypothetical protein GCM10007350_27810 [Jeongeupia chitinilytica]